MLNIKCPVCFKGLKVWQGRLFSFTCDNHYNILLSNINDPTSIIKYRVYKGVNYIESKNEHTGYVSFDNFNIFYQYIKVFIPPIFNDNGSFNFEKLLNKIEMFKTFV